MSMISDDDNPKIMQEKYGDFLAAIGVSEEGLGSFAIPYKLNAKNMGTIEEKEFVESLSKFGYLFSSRNAENTELTLVLQCRYYLEDQTVGRRTP
eukprot:18510-Amorphochlora_amoeboformis.AAC.2